MCVWTTINALPTLVIIPPHALDLTCDYLVDVQGKASLKQVADLVRVSGISKIELSPDDFQTIINSLVYDGKIEEVRAFHAVHQVRQL